MNLASLYKKEPEEENRDWVLPLEVVFNQENEKWSVVTRNGNPCGTRLLKGVRQPNINTWMFYVEHEANELCEKLTHHIENEWPKKKKKGVKYGKRR